VVYCSRWLKAVFSTFQDVDFDMLLLPFVINYCHNRDIEKVAQSLVNMFSPFLSHYMLPRQQYVSLKTPFILALSTSISETARGELFQFLLSNFGKKDKMQLLAKFKNNLYIRFGATLNFRKFNMAINPMYRIFLTLPKVAFYPAN